MNEVEIAARFKEDEEGTLHIKNSSEREQFEPEHVFLAGEVFFVRAEIAKDIVKKAHITWSVFTSQLGESDCMCNGYTLEWVKFQAIERICKQIEGKKQKRA